MRTFEDLIKWANERTSPSQNTMFSKPLTNMLLSSREGITVQSLVDQDGNPLFMVGSSVVGDGSVVG